MRADRAIGCLLAWVLALAPAARAVIVGTTDTFEDGTFQGWGGAANGNVSTGGPAGAGDHFLLVSSGSFGTMPNLATTNSDSRWIGSWTASEGTSLDADLKILGGTNLSMRAVLFGGSSGISQITTTVSQPFVADGAWHHFSFDVSPGAWTSVAGTDSVANVLASVNRIMIRHQAGAASAGGTNVSAQIGVDNVKAVPEPAAAFLLVGAMFFLNHSRMLRR